MRLLIDMNLSPRWAVFLREAGFGAEHWSVLGAPDAPDPIIMQFALAHAYFILTHDLDFGAMLAASGEFGPSVVQIRADNLSLSAVGTQVVVALRQAEAVVGTGALITVEPRRARMPLLPIRSAARRRAIAPSEPLE